MFRLLVITAPTALPNEPRLLAALLAAGPERLHLRKPGWAAERVEKLIQALPAQFRERLVLHGHPDLVRRYRLGGLHLTASQRTAAERRPRLLPGQSLSTSFHALAEISRCRRRYDYVFLSPIFDSISKTGYASHFALPVLRTHLHIMAARPGYRPPVLALGGVAAENVDLLPPVGFAGAAVLGSIWQNADPVAAFRQLQAAARPLTAYASAASQSFHTGS